MRIGIDARELEGHSTGVGRYLGHLLEQWAPGRDHEYLLYHRGTLGKQYARAPFRPRVVEGARVGGTRWLQVRLPRAMRADRPDVFFGPGYAVPYRCPCPAVVAIHDASFAAHPEWFAPVDGFRRRWLARLSARRAALVLTLSNFSRDEIVRYLGVPSGRVKVVPPGAPPGAAIDASHERLVLYVGTILNRRHVPDLIRGFARYQEQAPPARLAIVGANRTRPHEDLAALVATLGLGPRVEICDYVSADALQSLYRRAGALAYLSEYEGFGLPPLEAMAAGIPVVLADVAVSREIYGEAAVRVDPARPEQVASALGLLLDNGERRRELVARGRQVASRYRWADAARQVLASLEEVARAGRAR